MDHAQHLATLFDAAYRVKEKDRIGDTSIHVSDLINFCAREYWLCKKHDRSYHPHKWHNKMERHIFDMGHAMQRIQIQRLLTQQVIYGAWHCRHCGAVEIGFQDSPPCSSCRGKAWRYEDLRVEVAIPIATKPKSQILLVGNIDYVVALSEVRGFLVDGKSIKEDSFDALPRTGPSIDYRRQVQLYMKLLGMKGARLHGKFRNEKAASFRIDTSSAVVCYSVKGTRQNPVLPFLVQQDDKFCATIDKKVKELTTALVKQVAPVRICKTEHDMMAKACVIRKECFAD